VALSARAQGLLRCVRAGDDCNMAGLRACRSWVEQWRAGGGRFRGSLCQIADDMSEWDFRGSGNAAQNRHPDAARFDTDAAGRGFVFSRRPGDTNVAHSTMRARGCKLRKRRTGLLQNSDDRPAPICGNVQSPRPDGGAVHGVCARACSAARIIEQQTVIEAAPAAAAPAP
jgi:hypothetical protein